MDQLVIATHNKGKFAEFQTFLAGQAVRLVSAADLNLPEPDEIGNSFYENAEIKARASAVAAQLPALADDSGLCVTALGGAPGIYSARWALNKNFQTAMDRIFYELGDAAPQAEFVCVLALTQPNGKTHFFEGRCSGILIQQPRGSHGFGYDPYFIPDGYDQTFAELGKEVKDSISHRAQALDALIRSWAH